MYLSPWILGLMVVNIEMVSAVLPSIKSKVICLTAQGSTSTSKVATTTSSFTIPIPHVSTYTPTTTVTPKAFTTISIVTALSTTTSTLAQVTVSGSVLLLRNMTDFPGHIYVDRHQSVYCVLNTDSIDHYQYRYCSRDHYYLYRHNNINNDSSIIF